MVVLDGEDATGAFGGLAQGAAVDGLDRVEIDHPDLDALAVQHVGGLDRLVDGDPCRDDRQPVGVRGAQHLAAADRELLGGAVEDGHVAPGGAQIADAFEAGHRADQLRGLVGVARVQHGRAVHRAHHRQVLQAHLRGPVLADGGTRVGADEIDAGPADRRHADEVVGAGEERRERGDVRHPAARREPHRGGHQLLFGDVALEEPLGVFLGEELGASGVADLAVQGDDIAARGAERGERLPVGVPGRDLVADLEARQLQVPGADGVQHPGGRRLPDLDAEVAYAAEFRDRLVGVLERFAVQAFAVLDGLDALALEGAGEDHGGLPLGGLGLAVRAVHRVHVVPVDLDRVPAEGREAAGIGVQVVSVPGGSALPEPVDVHDRRQVVQMLERGVLGGLPHGALGEFAVAAQHPHPVVGVVQPLPGERDADADGQPLAERAGGRLHPWQPPWRGVPFEPAAQLPEGHQLGLADRARRLVRGIQQGRGVPLGQHEAVVAGVLGAFEVVPQMLGEQYRHQLGGRHGRRRMPGARGPGRAHAVDPQLLGQLAELTAVHDSPSEPLAGFDGSSRAGLSDRGDCGRPSAAPDTAGVPGLAGLCLAGLCSSGAGLAGPGLAGLCSSGAGAESSGAPRTGEEGGCPGAPGTAVGPGLSGACCLCAAPGPPDTPTRSGPVRSSAASRFSDVAGGLRPFSGAPGILASSGDAVSSGTDQDRTSPSWTPWRGSTASRSQSAATRTRLPGMAARW